MKSILKLTTVISMMLISQLLPPNSHATNKDFAIDKLKHKDYPDWFMDTDLLDLSEAVAEAGEKGKKGIFVFVGTEGCVYCYKFNASSLKNPEIAALVQQNFDTVGLEMFDDIEIVDPKGKPVSTKHFVKEAGSNFTPTIIFYDTNGDQVFKRSGYQSPERFRKILDYVSQHINKKKTFKAYLEEKKQSVQTQSLPLMLNAHFQEPPFTLNRSRIVASKPMFILFEKSNCRKCVDFHKQVLALDEVDVTLKKFDVVRLDMTDKHTQLISPNGKKLTPEQWYHQEGFDQLPALMFVDPNGNTSIKTDALVRRSRIMNLLNYMLHKAYEKDWTYQRFARSQSIKRNQVKVK